MKRNRGGLIVTCLIILIVGAILLWFKPWKHAEEPIKPPEEKPEPTEAVAVPQLSAWLADWEWETGLADLKVMKEGLTSLQLFASYFGAADQLHFTEEFEEALPELLKLYAPAELQSLYLTIVNDQFQENGAAIQKSPELISRLMATSESRSKHVEELVAAVDRLGFGGMEIDYEQIPEADWEKVLLFYSELYERLQAKGKVLRIVLEPRVKIEELKLPEGPEYVMMAYNLYGYHSGPGPKADHAFIAGLANRMEHLPGKPAIAFSVGGFDWDENAKVKALTEKQAALLLKQTDAELKRDDASGSVYFDYTAKDGAKHQVWYADEETLKQWIDTAQQAGYSKVAIWRLGELEEASLNNLKSYVMRE
ncbi:glycosyl hydrolase family 18 protein [Paenibacillus paridis]|uniref:glycosyl hydrolase family 18 protein n=1 Tax=Paenibacillus paridis TaxID=2583376 RepID=UPI001EE42990|nr:glycosyl hydrolase family 18 protein [Paenibacillus paridis]